jgi:hypothetical protein
MCDIGKGSRGEEGRSGRGGRGDKKGFEKEGRSERRKERGG